MNLDQTKRRVNNTVEIFSNVNVQTTELYNIFIHKRCKKLIKTTFK